MRVEEPLTEIEPLPFKARCRRLADLRGLAGPEARAAALPAVATWAPWAPGAPALLAGLVTDLGETRAWREAPHALVRCVTTGIGAAELGTPAAELAAAPPARGLRAHTEPDVAFTARRIHTADE